MEIILPWTCNTQDQAFKILRFIGLLGFIPAIYPGIPSDGSLNHFLIALSVTAGIVSLVFICCLDLPSISFRCKQPNLREDKQ